MNELKPDTVGSRIKNARKMRKMTQKELGEELGITQQTIAMFENDKTNMKLSTIEKISNILDIPVGYILSADSTISHEDMLKAEGRQLATKKEHNRYKIFRLCLNETDYFTSLQQELEPDIPTNTDIFQDFKCIGTISLENINVLVDKTLDYFTYLLLKSLKNDNENK